MALDGRLSAWPRTGILGFALMEGTSASTALPREGSATELLFKIRGMLFRYDGQVGKLDSKKARVLIKPHSVEWSERGFTACGARQTHDRATLTLRDPAGKTLRPSVLSVDRDTISFVCWPSRKKLADEVNTHASLDLPGASHLSLRLRVVRARPVFPGSQGRVVVARLVKPSAEYLHALSVLEGHRDRVRGVA